MSLCAITLCINEGKPLLHFLPIQSSVMSQTYFFSFHLFCPPFLCFPIYCLSYQPIHQWVLFFNKWRRSQPAGESGWKPSEYRKPFYLFLSLFSLSLMFLFPHSLSLSLRYSLPLFVCVSGDCSESRVHAELWLVLWLCKLTELSTWLHDYGASLTHLHLFALYTMQPLPDYSAGLGWTNTEIWLWKRSLGSME